MTAAVFLGGLPYIVTEHTADAAGVSTVSATPVLPEERTLRLVTYGDSFTAEKLAVPEQRGPTWSHIVADALGLELSNRALGGTGYTAESWGNIAFPARVAQDPPVGADVVLVFGSVNDVNFGHGVAAEAAAAADTLDAIQAAAPDAVLIVVGPQWPAAPAVPALAYQLRDVVQAAAAERGAVFVDALTWFQGHPELIGSDGLHPNDAGHRYMAALLRPTIAQLARPRA